MKTTIDTHSRTFLADLQTPVGIYLKVRDLYPESALLESSDYHSSDNSFSYIGIEPVARFTLLNGCVSEQHPGRQPYSYRLDDGHTLCEALNGFLASFEIRGEAAPLNGLFGYTAYDAIPYFEGGVPATHGNADGTPQMDYILYRYIVTIDHLSNRMTITENRTDGTPGEIDSLAALLESRNFPTYGFETVGQTESAITDDDHREMIRRGIAHCLRGDVFQIVLSRRFMQRFRGDDFNVYRALRSINPSPYLFYFDFGSYRIFGSSPETHLKIEDGTATIDPIAGTFRRTGDDEQDRLLAEKLLGDAKENAEHVMLVDLARNDLSRNTTGVYVKSYKEIQFYSHVLHMVSRVCGNVSPQANPIRIFADTFPAGTLSGAPKVRAMQLIDSIERHGRGIYGGCIGFIGFDGGLNQAITIRTFLSRDNTLHFQAGGGIVAKSDPDSEVQEVLGKLGALRSAIEQAGQMKH